MSYRTAIHDCLRGDSRVTALIGTGDACRHYPVQVPQGVSVPFVASYEISGGDFGTHGLPGDAEDTLDESLVQFSCFAADFESAQALRKVVRAALLEDTAGVLAAAGVRAMSPQTRDGHEDDLQFFNAQLDLTFTHNPQS